MAALLEKIYQEHDWKWDPNKPGQRIKFYKQQLAGHLPVADELKLRQALGDEMLRAGDSEGAVQTLEEARAVAQRNGISLSLADEHQLTESLAIAYLRLGEQENCLHYHGQHSCIFPIRKDAVHTLTRGAEGAVREYTALLNKNPRDAQARWLLNIAYMQLGKYPQQVPVAWVIPEKLFESEYDIGDFADVAASEGLTITGHAGGVCVEDFDGDGLLDLMVSSSGPHDQLRFFHSNGDGTFSDRTVQAGLIGETGGLNLVCADYNNDGRPDVVVLRGGWWRKFGDYPLSLLRNEGNGRFADVTEEAGMLSPHPTQTAAWADFDNDGWLDLYVGHESAEDDPHPSQLFRNNHDGTFSEVAALNGLADMGYVKGVAWGDFNKDGRPDLYVSIKGKPNRLFRNDRPRDPNHPGAWRFTDVTTKAHVAEPKESFATWFFDYDNDGWPDIFVAGYAMRSPHDISNFEMGKSHQAETPRLYHNNHDGTFTDVSAKVHLDRAILPMGASFGDLDNDGWLDVYLGTGDPAYESLLPNRMFRNEGGTRFEDVTTSGGFGNLQKGHGVAFADLGNTGHEDVFELMGGAFPGDTYESVLYRNPAKDGNHWITLDLEGVKTNRSAIGARITITLDAPAKRRIYRTVGYGSSFGGNPLRQHIGLGKATRIEAIEVYWPTSRTTQRFKDVPVDQAVHLREDQERLQPVSWKVFALPEGLPADGAMPAGMHHAP